MSFKRVLKNTSYILIAQQLSKVINFVQVIILVRYLGKDNFGVWSVVQAIPSMLIVLAHMGSDSLLIRKIVRNKSIQEESLAQVLSIRLILSFFFISVVYVFTHLFQYEHDVKQLIFISSISLVIISYNQVIASVFRASENFIFAAVLKIVRSVVLLLLVCLVILFDLKLSGLVYGLLIAYLMITILCFSWYKKKYALKIKFFKFESYAMFLKSSFPFALLALAAPLFMQIDIILLSRISTFESVAFYNAPYKIILFLSAVPFALNRALFPNLTKLYNNNKEKHFETFRKACKIIAFVGLPISIGTFFYADKIVYLLFSDQFTESIIPLKIMAIMLFFNYLRSIFNVTLYASNMEYPLTIIFALAIVLNIILDLILIPRWDYVGACVATLLSEVAIMGCSYYLISSRLFNIINIKYFKTATKFVLSALTMSILVILSKNLPLPAQITAGMLGYFISIYIFKVFSVEEYKNIKKLFQLRK